MDRMRPSSTERREEPRAGGVPEQTAECVFWVEKTPGVASGVARGTGKTADDGHYEGDKDSVVVAGFAVISCCFCFVGTPSGVLQAGLGLRVDLAPPLDMTIGRGGGIEYEEIDPVRCFVVLLCGSAMTASMSLSSGAGTPSKLTATL